MTDEIEQSGSAEIMADLSYKRARNHFKGMCNGFIEDGCDEAVLFFALLGVSLEASRAAAVEEAAMLRFLAESREMAADLAEDLAKRYPAVAERYQKRKEEKHDTGARH